MGGPRQEPAEHAAHDVCEPELDAERVVWIGEGAQIGYLPEIARIALGHDWI